MSRKPKPPPENPLAFTPEYLDRIQRENDAWENELRALSDHADERSRRSTERFQRLIGQEEYARQRKKKNRPGAT